MTNRIVIFVFAVLTLISAVVCEIVSVENCAPNIDKCKINEVRIDPCKEAATKRPCKIKRGKPASIEIDYTANFASETFTAEATYLGQLLPQMETNACLTTPCPVVPGSKQTYKYELNVDRKFPSGIFNVRWSLTGQQTDDQCCAILKIFLK